MKTGFALMKSLAPLVNQSGDGSLSFVDVSGQDGETSPVFKFVLFHIGKSFLLTALIIGLQ